MDKKIVAWNTRHKGAAAAVSRLEIRMLTAKVMGDGTGRAGPGPLLTHAEVSLQLPIANGPSLFTISCICSYGLRLLAVDAGGRPLCRRHIPPAVAGRLNTEAVPSKW